MPHLLASASGGWYEVAQRLPHLPVTDTLGIRKVYADGEAEHTTYTIRKIYLTGGRK